MSKIKMYDRNFFMVSWWCKNKDIKMNNCFTFSSYTRILDTTLKITSIETKQTCWIKILRKHYIVLYFSLLNSILFIM